MKAAANTPGTHIRYSLLALFLMLLFLATGCGLFIKPEITKMNSIKRVPVSKYPFFEDNGDFSDLIASIDGSLAYLSRIPGEREFYFNEDIYTAEHLKKSLHVFRNRVAGNPTLEELNQFIRENYRLYCSVGSDGRGKMLFTG